MTLLALPGPSELWIIALIVLLLFGARKLPDLARAMGSSISQFKRGLKDEEGADGRADPLDSAPPPPRVDAGTERPHSAGSKATQKERG